MTRQRRRSKPMPQDKCKHESKRDCFRVRLDSEGKAVKVKTGAVCERCDSWWPVEKEERKIG